MATLADELAADFLDSGSEGEGEVDQELGENGANGLSNGDQAMDDEGDDVDEEYKHNDTITRGKNAVADAEDEEEAKARVEKINFGAISDVRSVASLMKSLKPVVEKIDFYQSRPASNQQIGSIEDNPEYKLLTESNSLSTRIDGEVILVHKFLRDHYSVRFPELEKLVENPLNYAKTVAIIGNDLENLKTIANSSDNVVGVPLDKVLDKALMMSVRMEATTTIGKPMSETQLKTVNMACSMVVDLAHAKTILGDYVTSRMNVFAPNLTTLIGSETAAQLVNTAGGVAALSRLPSSNLANMGWKSSRAGLATNVGVRQKGYLYYSSLVQNCPMDTRVQAMRIISAKVTLACRVDATLKTHDVSVGQQLREQVASKLEKLTDAAPAMATRALPNPEDRPATKRGGRRARKAKEQYALTDLQKQQNRMVFGKEEAETGYGTGDSTKGLGMIGAQNDGRIRGTTIDKRTAARLSKKNPGWGGASGASGLSTSLKGFGQGGGTTTGLRTSGVGGGAGGGTASVISFTPFQGLELVDPRNRDENERKRKADEDRYFKSGTFTAVGGGSSMAPPEPKMDSGGFKVPALPALKRVKKQS